MEIPLDVRREELALRPSADAVMNRIVPDYVVGFVYGALVESFSCEQNALYDGDGGSNQQRKGYAS